MHSVEIWILLTIIYTLHHAFLVECVSAWLRTLMKFCYHSIIVLGEGVGRASLEGLQLISIPKPV